MGSTSPSPSSPLRAAWRSCLALLALAGATGVLFRLVGLGQVQVPWPLAFVRHAHSHAVLFGWAIPAMFLALAARHRPATLRARGTGALLAANQLLALASWPLFLGWGYGRVPIGGASLPLPVIVSGLVMFAWYGWSARWATTRQDPDASPIADRFASAALVFLCLASLGAWGVAAAQALGHGERVTGFLTHAFLHLLSLGFLGVGACSLLIPRDVDANRLRALRAALWLVGLGIPLSIPYTSLHVDLPALRLVGRGALAAVATGGVLVAVATRSASPARPLTRLFLLARSAGEALLACAPIAVATVWTEDHSLRILYLHVAMVGFASLAIVDTLGGEDRATRSLRPALASVPLSLLLLSGFAPLAWRGPPAWWIAAAAGVAATLAAAWAAIATGRPQESRARKSA